MELSEIAGTPESEHEVWARASTLLELGEVMAQWLEGRHRMSPWYCGPPDPETKGIVAVLAKLNRAAFVSHMSQPGLGPSDRYAQRAYVSGFTYPKFADLLEKATSMTDLVMVSCSARDDGCAIPITVWPEGAAKSCRGRPTVSPVCTWGGMHEDMGVLLGRMALEPATDGFPSLSSTMVGVLANSTNVSVLDPVWGRNDLLWPLLENFVHRMGNGGHLPA